MPIRFEFTARHIADDYTSHCRESTGKAKRMKRATLALVVMAVATVLAAGTAMAVVDDVQRASAGRDAALDRALEELVSMRGGPPGAIAVVQRDEMRKLHTAGVADLRKDRPIGLSNRMRVASTSKAFSGAVALSLWLARAHSP
jgi:D-alanyl-D-alanine carboxypeptidase